MKKFLISMPLMLALSAPAHATGGLVCRTAGAAPIELSLVTGRAAVETVVSARLRDRGRNVPVAVAQSWLEPSEIRLDLVDPNAMRREARILARKNGRYYDGSIWRGGRRSWVRCREG